MVRTPQKFSLRNILAAGLISFPTPLFDTTDKNPSGATTPQNLANHIANILTALVIPIAVVGIIYSAYILISSQGNPDAYKVVKKNMSYLIGGIAIILFATYIFNFVVGFFQ